MTKAQPWKTELIQTVDDMIKYLEVKDLKQGYKLGDLLTRTCFIEGDLTIYEEFFGQVNLKLTEDAEKQQSSVMKQLGEDLKNFDLAPNLIMFSFNKSVNIKRIIYRTITLFVSALGRLNNLSINSGFEIIQEFQRNNLISNYVAYRLSQAVAVACHVRLSYYMSKNRQNDDIYKEDEIGGKEKLAELAKIVGESGLANCLATALILQEILKKNSSIIAFDKMLESKKYFSKMYMFNFLGNYDQVIEIGERYLEAYNVTRGDVSSVLDQLGDAYMRKQEYTKYLALIHQYKEQITQDPELNRPFSKIKYNELSCMMLLSECEVVDEMVEVALKSDLRKDERLNFLFLSGYVKYKRRKGREALSAFRDLHHHYEQSKFFSKDIQQATIMQLASHCLIAIGRREQGIHLAREGLHFVEMIGATKDCHSWFTDVIDKFQYQPDKT